MKDKKLEVFLDTQLNEYKMQIIKDVFSIFMLYALSVFMDEYKIVFYVSMGIYAFFIKDNLNKYKTINLIVKSLKDS